MRIIKALVAVAFVSSLAACGPDSKIYPMVEQGQSGQSGQVTFTEMPGGKVKVDINIKVGNDTGAQQAHIHDGQCGTLGNVYKPLTDVQQGKSTTEVDVPLSTFKANPGKYAVNVHSSANLSNYVSCGNL